MSTRRWRIFSRAADSLIFMSATARMTSPPSSSESAPRRTGSEPPRIPNRWAGEPSATRCTSSPAVTGRLKATCQVVAQQDSLEAAPQGWRLEQHVPRRVRGHCETEALRAPGIRDDVTHDADHFAVHAEQRSAAVAAIDRRIGLKQFGHGQRAGCFLWRAACAQVPNRQGARNSEWRADDEYLVADFGAIRIT